MGAPFLAFRRALQRCRKRWGMRVPRDRSLASWIRELEREGRLYRFYKTDEWKGLRRLILEESHNECAHCKERGEYGRAVTVHHVNEVRDRPELALSRTYIDARGKVRPNLVPLCFRCHNKAHGRDFCGSPPRPRLNEERW